MLNRCLLFVALISTTFSAQAQGIHFEEGNWASVRKKAIEQDRLIYVDVYTTWCGPCKILEMQIFQQKAAGDKFNASFVNYRVDAEKGEGIAISKKYSVSSYPTNLYIDPKTEKIIYRTSGVPMSMNPGGAVSAFNKDADLAMQERNEPMTWEKFEGAFANGRRDTAFLNACLLKSAKLKKNNDAILNEYVAILNKNPVRDSDILFLCKHVRTVDNNAIAFLASHKDLINLQQKIVNRFFEELCTGWVYSTLQKAIDNQDTTLFAKMDFVLMNLSKDPDLSHAYWYRTQYFEKLGDYANTYIAAKKQGDYLISLPESYFVEGNEKKLKEREAALRWQLITWDKVPEDKVDSIVNERRNLRTYMRFQKSTDIADALNNNAWKVYERQRGDQAAIEEALKWSGRATALGKDLDDWPTYADTYAHLLFAAGRKSEAVFLEQQVVDRAKKGELSELPNYEASLKKMQKGTL